MALAGRGYEVVGLAWFFLVTCTISVILRCYTRLCIIKIFGLDDWFALLSWVLFCINIAFVVTAAYHGTGQHFVDMPPAEIPIGLKWWWFCEPIFVLAAMAIKFSIGIYLIRIAQSKLHKAILWTTITVMEMFSFFFFILFILQCSPSNYFWTRYTGAQGTCLNLNTLVDITYTYSAIACATDWVYATMPVFILWDLKMDRKTKISVGILIGLGASASIATVIRIPYLKGFKDTDDFLYSTTDVAIWTTAEMGIGISAACFATLRPLFRKLVTGMTRKLGGESKSGTWSKTPNKEGYTRSVGRDVPQYIQEYELRHKVGANSHVKTDIEAQTYVSREETDNGDIGIAVCLNPTPASPLDRVSWSENKSVDIMEEMR